MNNDFLTNLFTLIFSTGMIVATIIFYLIFAIGLWKMFAKMGVSGILAFIPIVNVFILTKKVMGSGWYILLSLVPIVNIGYYIMLDVKTAKAFGAGMGTALGLMFLPGLFHMLIGFSEAKYIGDKQ